MNRAATKRENPTITLKSATPLIIADAPSSSITLRIAIDCFKTTIRKIKKIPLNNIKEAFIRKSPFSTLNI